MGDNGKEIRAGATEKDREHAVGPQQSREMPKDKTREPVCVLIMRGLEFCTVKCDLLTGGYGRSSTDFFWRSDLLRYAPQICSYLLNTCNFPTVSEAWNFPPLWCPELCPPCYIMDDIPAEAGHRKLSLRRSAQH